MKNIKTILPLAFAVALLGMAQLWLQPVERPGEYEYESGEEETNLMGRVMGRFHQEWLMTHDPATGIVPRQRLIQAYKTAQLRRQDLSSKSGIIPLLWEERGPNNVGGRTRGLMFDANDPSGQTVWAAGVSGGLWRCDDITAGTPSWTNIDDFFSTLAITTIAQDPTTTNIMYFGTGENGFGNADAVQGLGIWRSLDGGATWAPIPFTLNNVNFRSVNKVLVDGSGDVFAATTAGLFQMDNTTEIWTKVLGLGAGAGGDQVQDIEIAADGTMYAAINSDGIYQLPVSGSWGQLTDSDFPASGFARIELAVAPSDANTVYAAFATTTSNSQSTCLGVFVTTDAGGDWTAGSCPMNLGVFCWYAYIMAVDPNDPTRVWLGDVNLFVSGDSGNNWTQVTGVHADHHALVYRPGSSDEMIYGNDGGVYRSTDASAANPTLVQRNSSYNVTQFYTVALHPGAANDTILGGTQDNGTQRFDCSGLCNTDQPTGNDGAFCFIDADNPQIQITGSQNRLFFISTDGGANFNTLISGDGNGTLFITPAAYDSDNDIFYFSDGNDTLGRITSVGVANTTTFDNIPQFGNRRISTFRVSPNTPNRLFVGTTGGGLLRIDNAQNAGATTVTPLTTPFTTFVSSIDVEDGDDMHLLAMASAYGVNSVFESTAGGTTWDSVEGDLPDMPVRWGMFHPADATQALLATELG
ncbi:MAG: hypothetical protein KDC54_14300, partial [Lewinella sp.]|nr:hypothetical protein [Lewinella sp.]